MSSWWRGAASSRRRQPPMPGGRGRTGDFWVLQPPVVLSGDLRLGAPALDALGRQLDRRGGTAMGSVTRRTFGAAAASTLAMCALPGRLKADAAKLKVGVLLPRSGLQALIGQSCQRGADVAPELLRQRLGVDVELMNADTESNVDTARSRAERLIEQG